MDTPVVVAVALVAVAGGAVLGVPGPRRLGFPDDEGRAGGSPPHRGRSPGPPEGTHPRGQGREAPPAGARPRKRPGPSATNSPAQERRLLQRDEQLDQRTEMLEQRDRKLLERERELDKTKEELAKAHRGTGRRPGARQRPERRGRQGRSSLEAVREEAEHDAVKLARAIERSAPRRGPGEGPRHRRHRHAARGRGPHRRAHGQRRPPAQSTR